MIVAVLAAAAGVALPASAGAATVSIGSALTNPAFNSPVFADPTTFTNTALPGATVTAPSDGTLVSWSFEGASGPIEPKVISPSGGGNYTAISAGTAQVVGPINRYGPFVLNAPVRQGDLFGVTVAGGARLAEAPLAGANSAQWQPPLTESPGRAPSFQGADEKAVAAVLRYCLVPKVKTLKLKSAKRKLRDADCTVGKVRKSKKVRNKKKVVKQSMAPGLSISDTTPIDLRVSRKS
jgi:hypothetical protein